MEASQLEDLFLDRLQRLCSVPSPLVVGVSGGQDSMALLTLLVNVQARWPAPLFPVHVDHGIRPESAEDALFVDSTVRRLFGLKVAQEHIRVLPKAGESVEMAARRERYALLEKHRHLAGPGALITVAHHRRDQAETVLMRLVNGTGIRGLQGMRERNQKIVRPLLTFSPVELREYLQQHQVPWCEDESNQDTRFLRNRIRWELLPVLADRFNPQIEEALASVAQRAQESYAVIHGETETFLSRNDVRFDQDVLFLPQEFAELKTAIQTDIFETVASSWHLRVNHHHIFEAIGGEANWPDGVRVRRHNRGGWVIWRHPSSVAEDCVWVEQVLPEEGSVDLALKGRLIVTRKHFDGGVESVVCIDKEKWSDLWVRPWQQGDRIEPLGMKGHHKKVGDVFTDYKVPRERRPYWPIIVNRDDMSRVLGIAGIMTAEIARCQMGAVCTQIRYVDKA